jgi:hypothetical protein
MTALKIYPCYGIVFLLCNFLRTGKAYFVVASKKTLRHGWHSSSTRSDERDRIQSRNFRSGGGSHLNRNKRIRICKKEIERSLLLKQFSFCTKYIWKHCILYIPILVLNYPLIRMSQAKTSKLLSVCFRRKVTV